MSVPDPIIILEASDADVLFHRAADVTDDMVPEMVTLGRAMLTGCDTFGGIGMAAPQVGYSRRMFVISYGGANTIFINPKIIKTETPKLLQSEGCLSFPGKNVAVARYKRIKVEYTDGDGKAKRHYLSNMMARVFQHELDHLDGITILEHQDIQNET